MNDLSGYEFVATGGRHRSIPGLWQRLKPILLVAAEKTSHGCVERLEHEYALESELDAAWAARDAESSSRLR
jgi:hypothetical protein